MKKLILLRHAKSSWSDPDLDDHDRPLNARGRAAAPVIGQWMAHRRHLPDFVLSSSARRNRQTVKRLRKTLCALPEAVIDPALYHASPDAMRERLAQLDDSVDTALLVGHQPGLSSLVRQLSNGHVRPGCNRAFEHFPTAAAAVLELPIESWSELEPHKAIFVDFARPRDLIAPH